MNTNFKNKELYKIIVKIIDIKKNVFIFQNKIIDEY